jgi:hypothetical protein
MRMDVLRFNTYLLAVVTAMLLSGCQTSSSEKKKELALIELHMEANPDGTEKTETVQVFRNNPIQFTINSDAFLDTRYLTNAIVLDTDGGFAIQFDFDKQGAWRLESATSMNAGRHVLVHALFPESRWLAAPLPKRRIGSGRLTFTPDCTREEADRLVRGLAKTIKEVRKK